MKDPLLLAWRRLLPVLLLLLLASCDSSDALTEIGAFDEWATDTPASQNLDAERLNQLTEALQSGAFGEVHSLLIARNGVLVYEEYFRGARRDGLHQVYSVTKSVTSALIGIAIAEGHIDGVDTPLLDFFPAYKDDLKNKSDRKTRITLEDALNMQAGFQWDEWSTPYNSGENPTAQLVRSADWMKYVLDLPVTSEPGARFTYNSGVTMLLSGILRQATGSIPEHYARDKLFKPLGINEYSWQEGPGDITNTGWGLFLTPRDMARFGHLYLMDGRWGEQRIIAPEWIDVLQEPASMLNAQTGYTYQWWLMPPPDGGSGYVPYANGYGGQFIFVIPSMDMVVVSTARNFSNTTDIRAILNEYIFPAVN